MRIIGGLWRGRKLRSPAGDKVRPTTDRTKEALFNILGQRVRNTIVLDLCCGAGGLGIEALSRGATKVIFVDSNRSSLQATEANLKLCGAKASQYALECQDALAWLSGWRGASGRSWTLICDPPYQSTVGTAMISLVNQGSHPPGLICAVIEYGSRTPDIDVSGPGWQSRRYGESHLAIYSPDAEVSSLENRR